MKKLSTPAAWFLLIAAAVLMLLPLATASANEQVAVPEESGLPLFQHWLFDEPGGNEWMAFLFYRPINCVPDDHNLYAELDVRALFLDTNVCPYLVHGFSLVEEPVGFPKQGKLWESEPFPLWFAPADWFYSESDDGVLLMSELRAQQAAGRVLEATVTKLNWELHPFPGPAHTVLFSVSASGFIDGSNKRFTLHASHVLIDPPPPPVVLHGVVFNLEIHE